MDDETRAIDEHGLETNEGSRDGDDLEVRGARAEAIDKSFHPERRLAGGCDRERAWRIGSEVSQNERAACGHVVREIYESVELSGSIGETRQRENAKRDGDLRGDGVRDRRAYVGETESVRTVNGVVRFASRRSHADRDRVEARVAESSEGRRLGSIRLEVDGPESSALPDHHDGRLDDPNLEKRLTLAGATERDDRPATFEMPGRGVSDLLRCWSKSRRLGGRRLGVVVEDENIGWSLVAGRRHRQGAIVASEERVGGCAAPIVLGAPRELAKDSARWLVALHPGDARCEIGRRPAIGQARIRVQGQRRDHELAVRAGADRGVRARPKRRRDRVIGICGETHAEIADRKDRGDPEATLPELSGAAGSVESDGRPAGKVDDVRAGGKRKESRQRTDRCAIGNRGRVIGRDDETAGAIAVNSGEHASEDRWREQRG
jgi:hypothetical protein